MHATQLWSAWQALALDFAAGFPPRGRRRFVEWVTGLALNVEEHTLTQYLVGLDRPQDGRALESFAEYGSWYLPSLEWNAAWRIDRLPGRLWHGYRVWAGDDTKVHRNSPGVWGTCTFHEHSARCPNRAGTVRAHNWVVVGALLPGTDEPALFLPVAGRLYFRQGQLPAGEPFRTKCQLLVELLRWRADPTNGPALAVFDGGFALRSVVRPLVLPDDPRQPRVEFVTRLRHDARLHARPPQARRPGQRGPQPRWGKRLPRRVADRGGVPVWAAAVGALEGGRLPVAGAGARGAGQGGGGRGRGLPQALHAGDQRRRAERAAGGGAVRRPLPAGGRLPRPQGAAGLGGVPGLDEEPGRADHAGAVRDADAAAAAATAAAGAGGGGLVAAPAVEPAQGAAECAGRGAAAAAAPRRNPAASVGLAGE